MVAKLLALFRPQVALFGEKDYQQLQVISRLNADLELGAEIVGMPTVREADGLAMSSRNSYLSPEERQRAPALSRGLFSAQALAKQGDAALPELRQVYLAGHPASCMFAAIALSQIKDSRTRMIFEEGAASESAEVRKWAEKLGKQGELDRVLREVYGEVARTEPALPAAEVEYLNPELLMIGVRKLEGTKTSVHSGR